MVRRRSACLSLDFLEAISAQALWTCLGFSYQLNVYNTPMVITYAKSGGSFWTRSTLNFTAANAWAPGTPLFVTVGDGEKNCTVETYPNSDPVSTLLAAYALSCRLDPREFGSDASTKCEQHIRLGMPPGFSKFAGMDDATFKQMFTYSAPVPQVFAEAVPSYVPPSGPPVAFATPVAQAMLVAEPISAPFSMEQNYSGSIAQTGEYSGLTAI